MGRNFYYCKKRLINTSHYESMKMNPALDGFNLR